MKDLLEKRGHIYSERPVFPILEMYVLWRSYLRSATTLTTLDLKDGNGLAHIYDRNK